MAAIAPRFPRRRTVLLFAPLLWIASAPVLRADQAAEIRGQLSHIADSLTGGDAADAMSVFSKSFSDYDKLRDCFIGLTRAFSIVNEVDVLTESHTETESLLTLHWTITLSDNQSSFSNQRAGEINVRFVREKNQWRITGFSPIDLFDPADAQKPAQTPKR